MLTSVIRISVNAPSGYDSGTTRKTIGNPGSKQTSDIITLWVSERVIIQKCHKT